MLDTPEDLKSKDMDHKDSPYHIEFDHVSFAYHTGRSEVVSDISFALKRGETLGIIGATGCGKSTIINLLIRFYDPDEGSIRIDGDEIQSIPAGELHEKFGIVFQNDVLFADTIEENIVLAGKFQMTIWKKPSGVLRPSRLFRNCLREPKAA